VKPDGDALVLELMHWADEIVAQSTLDLPADVKLPEPEMKMAKMLIDSMSVDEFEPEKFTNSYHEELMAMIEARAAGKEVPRPKKAPARAKVVNLMDVLQQSLEESKKQREGRTAKAPKRAAHRASPGGGSKRKKKSA
jgi:DNA end-binding protein Ku